MATKRSAFAKNPLQLHATLEFRRAKTPGIILRHGGGSGFRYLEFVLPDQQRSVRVEWNSDEYKSAKANRGVPVHLIVDGGTPRKLTYKDGALYEKGRSKPFVDKKAAVTGKRFAEVFGKPATTKGVTRAQRPSGVADPFGWFGCVSESTQSGAGFGAAVGGVAGGVSGGVAGAATGAGAGAGIGGALGACFGLGWCTAEAIWG